MDTNLIFDAGVEAGRLHAGFESRGYNLIRTRRFLRPFRGRALARTRNLEAAISINTLGIFRIQRYAAGPGMTGVMGQKESKDCFEKRPCSGGKRKKRILVTGGGSGAWRCKG